MAYTTAPLVAGIINVKAGVDVQPYIDSAHAIVIGVCTSSLYTMDLLELIERWLSAHFYDINYPRNYLATAGGTGGSATEQKESVKTELGLNNTKYGQQALRVDIYGSLAAFENSMV